MKGFKKLALATAVAAFSTSAFAMQPIADAELSGLTGQAGITLNIQLPAAGLVLDQEIYDRDGLNGQGLTGDAGVIVIRGLSVVQVDTSESISVQVDADGNSGAPVLNIAVGLPASGLTINTGDLFVADDTTTDVNDFATWGYDDTTEAAVLDSSAITLGGMNLNIQLGNEVQTVAGLAGTQMIALDTTVSGGISIANTAIKDANSGGSITIADTLIVNAGGTDLDLAVGINVNATGLVIGLAQLGDAANGADIYQAGVVLGDATASAIGDIAIRNLQLGGTTITVSGH